MKRRTRNTEFPDIFVHLLKLYPELANIGEEEILRYQSLFKVELTFECLKCEGLLFTWEELKCHIQNIHLDSLSDTTQERCHNDPFPLPPKKNKLARSDASQQDHQEAGVVQVEDVKEAEIEATVTENQKSPNKITESEVTPETPAENSSTEECKTTRRQLRERPKKIPPPSESGKTVKCEATCDKEVENETVTSDKSGPDSDTEDENVTRFSESIEQFDSKSKLTRKELEDIKARTCPFCSVVLTDIAQCLPHYAKAHNHVIKAQEVPTTARNDGKEQCRYCGKLYLKENVDRHMILVHVWRSVKRSEKRKKETLCDICGRVFKLVC